MKEGERLVSKSVPSAGMKEEERERETEGRKQNREEGAADRSADPTDRPLVLPPCDAYRGQPALVSSFLTNRGDTVLSEEG